MAIRINDGASGYSGRVSVAIGSFSPDFDGEYTAPGADEFSGSINRSLNSFGMSLKETSWPAFWPQVSGQYTISAQDDVLTHPWTAHRDLVIFQGRIWRTNGNFQTTCADNIENLQETYGYHTKYCCYVIQNWAKNDPNAHRYQQWELMEDLGMLDTWALRDGDGNVIWGSADQTDAVLCNTSDVCPDYGSGINAQNYQELYHDRLFSRWALGSDMTNNRVTGVYWDGTDPANAFPQPRVIPGNTLVSDGSGTSGEDYDGVPDYDNDGTTSNDSQADYRRGHADAVEYVHNVSQQIFTVPSRCFVSTNGGRDRAHFDAGTADLENYEWYQAFDNRVVENVHLNIGSWNETLRDLQFSYSDTDDRLMDALRAFKICATFCRPIGSNELGRPYAMVDILVGGERFNTIDYYSQAQRDWASFWYALCMLDEEFMYGGLTAKTQPAPPPDEWFYDIGNPLRTRSLYTLNNDASGSLRTPDDTTDGRWFFEEFENGYFYACIPILSGVQGQYYGADLTTTYATTAYPATPSGKVARRLDAANYTSSLSGLSPFSYNTTRNDGGSPYNGSDELVEPAWRGGLVIWADS